MKKMIRLVVIIMVFAFSGNASAAYLYCDWINEGTTSTKQSRIDITGVQGNGLIQLQFNKYGPWVNPDGKVILETFIGSENMVRDGLRDYAQAFAIISAPYVFIFHSRVSDLESYNGGVHYQADVLCLQYRPDLMGFLLTDTWHTFYGSLINGDANEWYHATPNPNEMLIYYVAE
ncbi:MAG: hypothetical protein JRI67_11480 [Deltaproteobacteria bacterium]|nr:hypothetical protein [Deltaproteobacteria bacterium]